jgi:TP901 family phage tail tape measure protein
MGRLALTMAPLAIAAGAVLGTFGLCATKAMAFESAMADVAKVVSFDSQAEFKAMSKTVLDLSGRLPMAADGIAAIIAAAGQSGVAKNDLALFAEQAAKMGIAFDLSGDQAGQMMANWRAGMDLSLPRVYALADAVNHLSNNMNATAPALGEVLGRVGALGAAAGLAETQVAALGTAMLAAGAGPDRVSTAMSSMLTTLAQGESMSKRSADAFKNLGFSVTQMAKDMQTDAQGTIFKVLQAIADKPKELQLGLLSDAFGDLAIKGISPLLANMGNLSQAFNLVGDSAVYAGSMEAEFAARSKTTENALQLMRNRFNALSITVGNAFLPAIGWLAEKLGLVAEGLRTLTDSPFGQWLLKLLGVAAAAVLSITAFSAAMWGLTKIGPKVVTALAPIKTMIMGLSAPVLALIAVIGLLYAAYQSNFGGMADALNRCCNNIKLVFQGVSAVFASMKGSTGVIRGELAKNIEAAGLTGLVTTVSKAVYRLKLIFGGITEAFQNTGAALYAIFVTPLEKVAELFTWLGGLAGDLGLAIGDMGAKTGPASKNWELLGKILGYGTAVLGGLFIMIKSFRLAIMAFNLVLRVWRIVMLAGTLALKLWRLAVMAARLAGMLMMGLGWVTYFVTQKAAALSGAAAMKTWELAVKGAALAGKLFKGLGLAAVFAAQKGAMLASAVASKAFAAAQWLLNASLLGCPLLWIIAGIMLLAGAAYLIIKNWDAIADFFSWLWDQILGGISEFASYLWGKITGLGESIAGIFSNAWDNITSGIASFASSVWEKITGIGESISNFFGGIDLFECGSRILDTLIDGIISVASKVKDTISGIFETIRDLLPFSDAKEGPLSQLTLSGSRIMTTLAEGAAQGAGQLQKAMAQGLAVVGSGIEGWGDDLSSAAYSLLSPHIPEAGGSGESQSKARNLAGEGRGDTSYTISIANITLPNVKDAKDFWQDLANEIDSFGGGWAAG